MAELIRLEITVDEDFSDRALSLLALSVAHGWEERNLPTGELQCIVHTGHAGFAEELKRNFSVYVPEARVAVETVEEEDWVETWKEFFTPVEGGDHFLIVPPWEKEAIAKARESGRIPVLIEPRRAFGTGHHASTALCLKAISQLFSKGRIKPGMRFMDLGTGSGILGIASAKLGLHGQGADIDIVAVDNAIENRILNDVAEEDFRVSHGGIEMVDGPYDLILANILADPLKGMARPLATALGRTGYLVLSGMLGIQMEGVVAYYSEAGLHTVDVLYQGDWGALILQ